jgi:undecaprenyl-diphosphatase
MISAISLFDLRIHDFVIHMRNEFWDNFFLVFTWLGEWKFITVFFIVISILFYLNKRKNLIFPFFITVLGSGMMTVIIKTLVDRVRPSLDTALYTETGASFPSAHASLIFALCGFLIYCVWKFNWSQTVKIFSTIVLSLIIFLIGFSRLYLGVHFLSDVLAGYLVGLLWVLVGVHIHKK